MKQALTRWRRKVEPCGPGVWVATAVSQCRRFTLQGRGRSRLQAYRDLQLQVVQWRREIDGIKPS